MAQQYGGYNQVGYGNNPYDQREDGPAPGRYNNYAQGRYDDRTFGTRPICE
jgi:syntaxin 1B/2/3